MFAVIGALYASSQIMLVVESSDDMIMFTSLQQTALNVFSYQVLRFLEDAVRMYYQMQTWDRQFWRHVGGRAARTAHGTTHNL